MNNEEKILEMLGQMQADISGIKSDQAAMKADIAGIKTEQSAMKADQAAMKADIAGIKTRLDVEVTQRFNLLAEGQKDILDALTPKSEFEKLRSEMDVLKLAVCTLSQDLAELKKAQ